MAEAAKDVKFATIKHPQRAPLIPGNLTSFCLEMPFYMHYYRTTVDNITHMMAYC